MSKLSRERRAAADQRRYAIKALVATVATLAQLTTAAHAEQVSQSAVPGASSGDQILKYGILFIALAGVLPLAAWIRRYPSIVPKIWMLVGPLVFVQTAVPHLNIALVSWAEWPGFVKGFEFSALDLIVLALYLSLPRSSNPLPFRFSMFLYFFAVIFSQLFSLLFKPRNLSQRFSIPGNLRGFILFTLLCPNHALTSA
jgi:hypothetical protein